MKKIKLFFSYFFSVSSCDNLKAKIKNEIITIVENDIITIYEIRNKINTILFFSKKPVNQKNINRTKK